MGIPSSAILQEGKSVNTHENAIFTQEILEEQNINKILLVTSAFHMPRSLKIFQHLGIDAIPAPTDFYISQQELQEDAIASSTLNTSQPQHRQRALRPAKRVWSERELEL